MKRVILFVLLVASSLGARNQIMYRPFDWQKVERPGYVIYYPKRMEWLIPATVKAIDEINDIYANEFSGYRDYILYYYCNYCNGDKPKSRLLDLLCGTGLNLDSLSKEAPEKAPIIENWRPEKLVFILYPSQDFTQQKCFDAILPPGILGFTETLQYRVFVPYTGDYYNYLSTLAHETAHAWMYLFLVEKTRIYREIFRHNRSYSSGLPEYPLWFIEGWAEMFSRDYFQKDHQEYLRCLVYEALARSTVIDIEKPVSSLDQMGFEVYYLGKEFISWMKNRFGMPKMIEFLEQTIIDGNFYLAWKNVYGKPVSYFEKQWHSDLRKKYFKRVYDEEIKPKEEEFSFKIRSNGYVGYDNDLIVYYTPDPKWGARIEVKNLKTGKVITLHRMYQNQSLWYKFSSAPAIKNNKVAIVINRAGQDELLIYRIDKKFKAHREKVLRSKEIISISRPQFIDDNRIVFEGIALNGYSDIYVWDIKTRKLNRLTNDFYYQKNPVPFGCGYLYVSDLVSMYSNALYWFNLEKKSLTKIYQPKNGYIDQVVVNEKQTLVAFREVSINHSPEIKVWNVKERKIYTVWSDLMGVLQVVSWIDDSTLVILNAKGNVEKLIIDWQKVPSERCVVKNVSRNNWQLPQATIITKKADRKLRYKIFDGQNFYYSDATGERRLSIKAFLAGEIGHPFVYNLEIGYQNLSQRLEKFYGFKSYQSYLWRYSDGIKVVRDKATMVSFNYYYPLNLEDAVGFGFSPNVLRRYYSRRPQTYTTIGSIIFAYFVKDGVFWDYWGSRHGKYILARIYGDFGINGILEGYVSGDFRYYLRFGSSRTYLATRFAGLKSFGHDRFLTSLSAVYPKFYFNPFKEEQVGIGTDFILFQSELRFPLLNYLAFQPSFFGKSFKLVLRFDGSIFWYGGDIWFPNETMSWKNRVGYSIKLKLNGPLVLRYERYKYVNSWKNFNFKFNKSDLRIEYEF
ncbi:hypothetical protein J7K86_02475 [bacterium]|nr:hypothetical protein [bacterium]